MIKKVKNYYQYFIQYTFVRPARARFYPELHLGQPECLHANGRHREMVLGHHKGEA